jgi:hypothetical protein
MANDIRVFDCDGHIIESIPEMVPFLDPVDREVALRPARNRQGVFASLDDMHYPRNVHKTGEVEPPRRPRVNASNYRKGSGEDWVAFLEKAPSLKLCCSLPKVSRLGFFSRLTMPCVCAARSMTMYPSDTEK